MDVDDLYGLPLDRFVAERGALAKALRAAGRREEAAAVAGLRKPSVAAWAVNQLVRTEARQVAALLEAGDAVRAAQAALLAGGGDRAAMRAAAQHERDAVERLVATVGGLIGSGVAVADRVADTFHAAALDDDARAMVVGGRLERELSHVGLGSALGAGLAPPPARATAGPTPVRRPDRDERALAALERAEAERRERERAERRRVARMAESQARRERESADRAVQAAQDRRDRATQALAQAEDVLVAAQDRAAAAAQAHDRARADLDDAAGALS